MTTENLNVLGILAVAAGILYVALAGRHRLPKRQPGGDLSDSYPVQEYLTEACVASDSSLVGQTVREADLEKHYSLSVVHIHVCCQERETVSAMADHRLQEVDELDLEATADAILAAGPALGLVPVPNRAIQPWEPERAAFEVAGVVLAPTSGLQSGPARWPLGSVVDHVARTLPIPVGVPGQVEELQPAAS